MQGFLIVSKLVCDEPLASQPGHWVKELSWGPPWWWRTRPGGVSPHLLPTPPWPRTKPPSTHAHLEPNPQEASLSPTNQQSASRNLHRALPFSFCKDMVTCRSLCRDILFSPTAQSRGINHASLTVYQTHRFMFLELGACIWCILWRLVKMSHKKITLLSNSLLQGCVLMKTRPSTSTADLWRPVPFLGFLICSLVRAQAIVCIQSCNVYCREALFCWSSHRASVSVGHLYTGHIPPPVPKAITVKLGLDELLGFTTEVKLNVANNGNNASISCYRGADLHWKDQVRGEAVAACGNLNFSAVALLQGPLYVCLSSFCKSFPLLI